MDGLLVVKLSEVIRQVSACIDSVVRTCAVFSTYTFLDFMRLGYRYFPEGSLHVTATGAVPYLYDGTSSNIPRKLNPYFL
jgi:hypothetical protein